MKNYHQIMFLHMWDSPDTVCVQPFILCLQQRIVDIVRGYFAFQYKMLFYKIKVVITFFENSNKSIPKESLLHIL
jgi:hypothetical protein